MTRVLVLAVVAGVILVLVSLATRQRRAEAAIRGLLRRALDSHGAGRCVAAIAVLRHLRDLGAAETVAGAWDALELPLLDALPDCPPEYKAPLREALEDVAHRCAKRDVARRVMVMRDSLLG
jgi:hypothetical protein